MDSHDRDFRIKFRNIVNLHEGTHERLLITSGCI